MYTEHFGLKERPFDLTPDPKFLYLNPAYQEALAVLTYGVSARKGFVSLVGEAGTGKTTVLRRFVSELGESVKSVFVFNPSVSFREMLAFILSELEVEVPARAGKLELLQALNDFLLIELSKGVNVVVLIDEAQDLRPEVLEELRLLSNLETDKEKIIQIVFAGQPEFEAKLRDPSLRQLRQRIALRAKLGPLSRGETDKYVKARLRAAGRTDDNLFTAAAVRAVWRASRGIPRLVNVACDSALVVAYASGRQRVTSRVVKEAVAELKHERGAGKKRLRRISADLALAGALLAVVAAGGWLVPWGSLRPLPVMMELSHWIHERAVPSGLWAEVEDEGQYNDYLAMPPGRREPGTGGTSASPARSVAGQEVETPAPQYLPAGDLPQSGKRDQAGNPGDNKQVAHSERETDTLSEPVVKAREATQIKEEARQVKEAPREVTTVARAPSVVPGLAAPAGRGDKEESGEVERIQASLEAKSKLHHEVEVPSSSDIVPIRPGDTLTELAVKRYGHVSFTLLDAIKDANPNIGDIDLILAGQALVLPPLDGAVQVRREDDGSFSAWVVSTGSLQTAQSYVQYLADEGFAGRIALVTAEAGPGRRFVRIWVGGFASDKEAHEAARRLRHKLERLSLR